MTADERTLARLMRLSQRGDRQAYKSLLQESGAWLRRFFHRRIPPHQLDDLVQETLISLHAKRSSYDPSRPFLPWLAAIARYRWVDHLRRTYRDRAGPLEAPVAQVEIEEEVSARISLERLLAHLPPHQAQVIEMVKIKGRSTAEASRMSGQSVSLVKVNIYRGLKKLAALVEKAQ